MNSANEKFMLHVYDLLRGEVLYGLHVPGVHSLFEDGMPCEQLYSEVYDACGRLNRRLRTSEDPDVECILQNLLEIQKILCLEMYRCGTHLGLPQP